MNRTNRGPQEIGTDHMTRDELVAAYVAAEGDRAELEDALERSGFDRFMDVIAVVCVVWILGVAISIILRAVF